MSTIPAMQVADRFRRNDPYITVADQEALSKKTVFLAGLGLGSVIAEALVRIGVTRLILVDFDHVEPSNLNRQNFTAADCGRAKTEALRDRLLAIDPDLDLKVHQERLTPENLPIYARQADLIINTIDFDDGMTFVCNQVCRKLGKPVFFPMNLGWAALVYYFSPHAPAFQVKLIRAVDRPQMGIVLRLAFYLLQRNLLPHWFPETFQRYQNKSEEAEPQLIVGSLLVAARIATLIYAWQISEKIPEYPHPLFMDARTYKPAPRRLSGLLKTIWIALRGLG